LWNQVAPPAGDTGTDLKGINMVGRSNEIRGDGEFAGSAGRVSIGLRSDIEPAAYCSPTRADRQPPR